MTMEDAERYFVMGTLVAHGGLSMECPGLLLTRNSSKVICTATRPYRGEDFGNATVADVTAGTFHIGRFRSKIPEVAIRT